MAFIFYDTETTGTDAAFDQILQVAAILTDDDLDILDSFDLRCRLLPHVVPSIGAILITGVGIDAILGAPLSHYGMMLELRRRLDTWSRGGAVFAGWNSLSFDEEMLRQAFYQSLMPVFLTNTGGNRRADIMRMAQMVNAVRPGTISTGMTAEGKVTYRLGLVAAANGIVLDNAHDALADTRATLEIARLIRARAPDLWTLLLINAARQAAERVAGESDFLFLAESRFGNTSSAMVAPLGPIGESGTSWAMFDLKFDPVPFAAADELTLTTMLAQSPRPVRRAPMNKQPGLFASDLAPADLPGGRLPFELYQSRAAALRENPDLRLRITRILAASYADAPEPVQVEQKIYRGFPSAADQRQMVGFHIDPWETRRILLRGIEDPRFRQLGQRIIGAERPDLFTDGERLRWNAWLRDRWHAGSDVPWRSEASALAELDDLDGAFARGHAASVGSYRAFMASRAAALAQRRD